MQYVLLGWVIEKWSVGRLYWVDRSKFRIRQRDMEYVKGQWKGWEMGKYTELG